MSGDGFLSRWSRRKAGLDATPEMPPAASPVVVPVASQAPVVAAPPAARDGAAHGPAAPEPVVVPPTMGDVALLTRESDYSRFVASGTDPAVRNAAMRKLFSDPHFNVMDGLDTYIDDYSRPDPIPMSMLRSMHQAVSLGLFDDDGREDAAATAAPAAALACPDGEAPAPPAQSPADPHHLQPRPDDDADLRLQQDDAARRPGTGPGTRA